MRTFPAPPSSADNTTTISPAYWLTLGQACRLLNVDESTLRRWADAGQVRTFRTPGGHRRFAEDDVRAIVAGRSDKQFGEVGALATQRIRRQLHRRPDADWYATVGEAQRDRLRPLGQRLMALVNDYIARRGRRSSLLQEARETGASYGTELATGGLSLSQAMQAFTFFRRQLDQSAKQALSRKGTAPAAASDLCEQIMALADEVLLGIASAYEAEAGRS